MDSLDKFLKDQLDRVTKKVQAKTGHAPGPRRPDLSELDADRVPKPKKG